MYYSLDYIEAKQSAVLGHCSIDKEVACSREEASLPVLAENLSVAQLDFFPRSRTNLVSLRPPRSD